MEKDNEYIFDECSLNKENKKWYFMHHPTKETKLLKYTTKSAVIEGEIVTIDLKKGDIIDIKPLLR